jgi:hypothetical protein
VFDVPKEDGARIMRALEEREAARERRREECTVGNGAPSRRMATTLGREHIPVDLA